MRHLFTVLVLVHYTMAGPNDLSISQASNAFASRLYQELAKTPGNVLICPLSAHIALALVHQGAASNTRTELGNVLHLANSNSDIRNGYNALLTGLQDDVLKIATKLFPAQSFRPKAEYVTTAQQYFLSGIQTLNYGNANEAANIINKYVENKTNDKIHDIVKPDSLSDLTRLVIVNAVHFKASWAKTFPPAYTDNFKVSPTETIKTEFLGQTDYYPYKEDHCLDAKVLRMDYENGKYSMVFVLPNKEDGIQELENKMATTPMENLMKGLKDTRVEVTIPKFKLEMERELKDVFIDMGIKDVFDTRADLSNMVENKENLHVSSVIQKTFIDVNEKGTEAAAATGVVTPLSGGFEEIKFAAQWPFCFFLIQQRPTVILFSGRLVRPTGKIINSQETPIHKPTDKEGGHLNSHMGGGGVYNRFDNEEDPFSLIQESGTIPNVGQSQNINQQNINKNQGHASSNNKYSLNEYPKRPPPPESNHGQHSQTEYQQHVPSNYGQSSQFATQQPERPYYQPGPPHPQMFVPSWQPQPAGHFQNHNSNQQPSANPQNSYPPQNPASYWFNK